ncbi:MAG: ParB-like nuclease domain-containing protein [Polyangiaceae bacterium]|nr:ParB-like nuclease domain-containing protein [Polyangiaceae bacterium]
MSKQLNFLSAGIIERGVALAREVATLDLDAQIDALNAIREALHAASPFADEPVDFVRWERAGAITANDYNPNSVAPPEMRLLEHSITEDGYTQPIVAWRNGDLFEVVDGFHRNRVGRESPSVRARVHGRLPLSIVNATRTDRTDRIASTIRHNRARGKHRVQAMSDIVVELKRRNWNDEKIGRELGMDPDEVLRLTQITGLADLFADREFSKSWDVDATTDDEIVAEVLSDGKSAEEE